MLPALVEGHTWDGEGGNGDSGRPMNSIAVRFA